MKFHCLLRGSHACSFNDEGSRLWVTLERDGKVSFVSSHVLLLIGPSDSRRGATRLDSTRSPPIFNRIVHIACFLLIGNLGGRRKGFRSGRVRGSSSPTLFEGVSDGGDHGRREQSPRHRRRFPQEESDPGVQHEEAPLLRQPCQGTTSIPYLEEPCFLFCIWFRRSRLPILRSYFILYSCSSQYLGFPD